MKRFLMALATGAIVFGMVFAAAASLNLNQSVAQAGSDNNLKCTGKAEIRSYQLETDDSTSRGVRIGNLAGCKDQGVALIAGAYDSNGLVARTEATPINGEQVSAAWETAVPFEHIERVEIFLETDIDAPQS